MKPVRPVLLLLAAVTIVALVAVASCSKSNSSYNPTNPGGGGGGGGLELNSGNISPAGGGYKHVFATAGTFGYHCAIHSNMTGSVNVNASSTNDSVVVSIVGVATGFSPASVSVKPTGYVRWVNNDGSVTHTVTSN
jgi:plastocyanin